MSEKSSAPASVVLVNPPAEIVREENYDHPEYPHIGLAYIGGYLERHGGIIPTIIDGKMQRLTMDQVVENIVALRPTVVGFSAMTHVVITAAKIAEQVKQALPETKTVLGGFHPTFLPERSLEEFPSIDYLVVGEGEVAFRDLVKAVFAGDTAPKIPGVWHRNLDGFQAGRGMVPDDLDSLGAPAWHLFDRQAMADYCRNIPIMSQRGCPFACNFCSRPYGRVVRRRTPEKVVDEIEQNVREFGITGFQVYDETFTLHQDYVTQICKGIVDRGLNIRWNALVHANTIDLELFTWMKKAGCVEVCMGVESGNETIMASMKKGVTKEKILKAGQTLKQAGLPFSGTFILGHPNETLDSILDTIRFARELSPTRPAFGIMVPYPGTKVWELARNGEGGYLNVSENWEDYNKHYGNAVELENLPRRSLEIMKLVAYLYAYFWSPDLDTLLDLIAAGLSDEQKLEYLNAHMTRLKEEMKAPDYDQKVPDSNKRKAILTFMSREFNDIGKMRVYSAEQDREIPSLLRDELIFQDTSWKTGT